MFKLKTLVLKDFLSIQDATINLVKPGLYLITGHNEIGGDSNGCGKSTILAAIAFALWGRTPSGLRGGDVANWDSNGGYSVELVLSGPSGEYKIVRNDEGLELTADGKTLNGRKTDVQELIHNIFGSTYDIFFASTLFTSEMSDYLVRMGDADKKRLFKSIIGLERIDKAYAKAKSLHDQATLRASELDRELFFLNDFISAGQKSIANLDAAYHRFETDRKQRLEELSLRETTKPVSDSSKVFKIRTIEVALQKVEGELDKAKEKMQFNESTLREAYEKLGAARESIVSFTSKITDTNSLQGETECDKCGNPLGDKFVRHLAQLQADLSIAKRKEFALLETISQIEDEQKNLDSYFSSVIHMREQVDELKVELAKEDEEVRLWEKDRAALGERMAEVQTADNPYTTMLEQTTLDIKEKTESLDTATKEFKEITDKIDKLSFMKAMFSREGIAAQIIETAFGRLQSLANRYLTKICSEGFLLNISPQRELKSKALREEIDIYVTSKRHPRRRIPYAALSAGQKQRINIALLMALYKYSREVGRNGFDFIILDEVLDLSLGAKGQSDVVGLLRDILEDVHNVIVVSHKEGISHDFDYEIQVRLDSTGVSHVTQ